MSNGVWWLTSDQYGKTPAEVPMYYLRLSVRSDWLKQRDKVLWLSFVAELEVRSGG